jgi:hypothetical protein
VTIELALLTRVAYRGQEITGPRARGLLALLAGDLRRGCSTARLVEGLWPRELPEHPAKALQVVVSPGQGPAGRRRHRQHAHRLPPVPGRRAGRHRRRPATGGGGRHGEAAATLGPSAALARYEAYRRSLRDELGTDPGAALQAVQQQLLQGSAPVVRHGVPHEPNPLVGRDDDITAVAGPLRSSRITSIVGTGGLGETRLAHAVSRRAEQRVVHFVALAGVAADDDVAREVAAVVGAGEAGRARSASGPCRPTCSAALRPRSAPARRCSSWTTASTSWTAPPTSRTTVSPNDLRSPVALIAGWDGVVVILSPLPLCGPGGHDTSSVPAARFSPVSRWFHTS